MKNTKVLYILVAVLIISGVFLIGKNLINKKEEVKGPHDAPPPELAIVRAQDEANLDKAESDPEAVAKSLRRYAKLNNDKSRQYVEKYLSHENLMIKGAALEAFGAYQEADLKMYEAALGSADETYRISAIRGLAKRPEENRVPLMLAHLRGGTKMSDEEKLATLLAMINLNTLEAEKNKYRDEVISLLKNKDFKLRDRAVASLYELLPKNSDLTVWAYEDVLSSEASTTVAASLQYLISFDAENLKSKAATLPVHKDETYQLTLIEYLKVCPLDWKMIVEKMQATITTSTAKSKLADFNSSVKCSP